MAYLALIVEDVIINKWELEDEVTILGRTNDCDIQIDDQSVSLKHARIVLEEDPYLTDNRIAYLEDLKSTNGTQLNGKKIIREKLDEGDKIKIGFTLFHYISNQDNNLDETTIMLP